MTKRETLSCPRSLLLNGREDRSSGGEPIYKIKETREKVDRTSRFFNQLYSNNLEMFIKKWQNMRFSPAPA